LYSTEEELAYSYFFQYVPCSFLYQLQGFRSDIKVLNSLLNSYLYRVTNMDLIQFSAGRYSLFLATFVEEAVCSIMYVSGTFVKN
jgi:hypothetical protein